MLRKAAVAEDTLTSFEQWIADFRTKAVALGVTEGTYTRIMHGVRHDTTGLEAFDNQQGCARLPAQGRYAAHGWLSRA